MQSHKILHAKGLAVPHWPKQWGGADWTPVQHYIYTEELQFNGVPQPLPFNVSMCGPVVIAFGTEEQKKRFLPRMAALDDWWCQGFSEPGAGSDLAGLKTAAVRAGRPLRRQRPEDLDHAGAIRRLDLLPVPHRSGGQEAARHLLPADRHEDARHHRAADPDHGRRPRGQRGVLRRRQGAGREPDRPGEPRLGLRQVPARQRAHRHRPRRLLQAARAAHQGAGRPGQGRRQAADRGRALPREGGGRRGRAEGAGDDADARALRGPQPQGPTARTRSPRSSRSRAARSSRRRPNCCWRSPGPLALPYQSEADDPSSAPTSRRSIWIGRRRRRPPISTTARPRSTAAPTRSSATSSPRPCWAFETSVAAW